LNKAIIDANHYARHVLIKG